MRVSSNGNVCYILLNKLLRPILLIVDMTRLMDLDMSIDFRENVEPVFAKFFAKMESKFFFENCSKIAKFFFENERKFSRNFCENCVSRFSLETLVKGLCGESGLPIIG